MGLVACGEGSSASLKALLQQRQAGPTVMLSAAAFPPRPRQPDTSWPDLLATLRRFALNVIWVPLIPFGLENQSLLVAINSGLSRFRRNR
jgi:hypothetical protein